MGLAFALTKSFGGGEEARLSSSPQSTAFLLALVGEPNWAALAEAVLDVSRSG